MSETAAPPVEDHNWLEHYPVTLHAVLMGLFGLTLALHAASVRFPVAETASLVMLWVGIAGFAVISGIYLLKALRHPAAVVAEWHHPVKLAFFPTISISFLLLSTALWTPFPEVARIAWVIGAVGQGILTISVIRSWISHRAFEVGHLNPAWFIPAVGNVVAPVAGAAMGYTDISWLFFSAGMIFWLILLVLVFNRLIFHMPLPGKLFPTMVILIAPPAVGFVSYTALVGELDPFAMVLLNSAYVFAALVLFELPKLRHMPFALSWWALTFPLAALSIASFRFGIMDESPVHTGIGVVVLAALILIVAGLIGRTLLAATRGEICRPE
jgi:tellurite resistance protein